MPISHVVARHSRAGTDALRRFGRGAAVICLVFGYPAGAIPALAAGGAAAPTSMLAAAAGATTEWVRFRDSRLAPVRVIRGTGALQRDGKVEVVTFGTGRAEAVRVVRGIAAPRPGAALDPRPQPEPVAAKLLRVMGFDAGELFSPATAGQLDRVAFAVDGIESRHGADLRMWRARLLGPQGPMQVSAAAAFDVGGGDRFDMTENRLLGRAYLARLFRRYGNWPDAIAAYNWGPGNFDQWVVTGRPPSGMPDEVAHYVGLVLSDALVSAARW